MKNPFEELPDLPSQRRHHRLQLFPWEEATQHVPRLNKAKPVEGGQPAVESIQTTLLNGVKPQGGQTLGHSPQQVTQIEGVRSPEGNQTPSVEQMQKRPQFGGVRSSEG